MVVKITVNLQRERAVNPSSSKRIVGASMPRCSLSPAVFGEIGKFSALQVEL